MIQQQQAYFLEIYRSGMRTASDLMKASLENVQRMHSQQIEAVRGALDDNANAARELSEVRSLDQLVALQTRIAAGQLERTADLWSRLWRSATETQAAMIHQVQSQVGHMSDRVRDSANATIGSAMQGERKERKSA